VKVINTLAQWVGDNKGRERPQRELNAACCPHTRRGHKVFILVGGQAKHKSFRFLSTAGISPRVAKSIRNLPPLHIHPPCKPTDRRQLLLTWLDQIKFSNFPSSCFEFSAAFQVPQIQVETGFSRLPCSMPILFA